MTSHLNFAPHPVSISRSYYDSHNDELGLLKKQLDLLKSTTPFRVVEMAFEIEGERKKAMVALHARDAAVQRLNDAYASFSQKAATIERLESEVQTLKAADQQAKKEEVNAEEDRLRADNVVLEGMVQDLREEIKGLKQLSCLDKPPQYEDAVPKTHFTDGLRSHLATPALSPFILHRTTPPLMSRAASEASTRTLASGDSPGRTVLEIEENELDFTIVRTAVLSAEAEDIIHARNKLLAAIALPADAPNDALKPIMIPASSTLHEFLSSAPGPLRTSLTNYRALNELTTSWCPQREEHGYFLTPAFKCNTNPRVTTAHRWTAADVLAKMTKPTDCFYNKDGSWYYAGVYKAFRLDDLTTKEWEALSNETTQAIIKETISSRKNTSPQNVYEVGQLYAVGALRVACVALQCVGFNKSMYHLCLEHAGRCALNNSNAQKGKTGHSLNLNAKSHAGTGYNGTGTGTGSNNSSGLGSGNIWNAGANAIANTNANANIGNTGNGNGCGGLTDALAKMTFRAPRTGKGTENEHTQGQARI